MAVLRVLARLVEAVWMAVLGLVGLGVAMYCLDGAVKLGSARPDRLLHLPSVRRSVGRFLHDVALPGSVAALAGLCGLAALLIGLIILRGLLGGRRGHLAILEDGDAGALGVRSRVLRDMARSLAVGAPNASAVRRPRLRLRRRGRGGRLTISASRTPDSETRTVRDALVKTVAPISDPFRLRARARVTAGGRGRRVT